MRLTHRRVSSPQLLKTFWVTLSAHCSALKDTQRSLGQAWETFTCDNESSAQLPTPNRHSLGTFVPSVPKYHSLGPHGTNLVTQSLTCLEAAKETVLWVLWPSLSDAFAFLETYLRRKVLVQYMMAETSTHVHNLSGPSKPAPAHGLNTVSLCSPRVTSLTFKRKGIQLGALSSQGWTEPIANLLGSGLESLGSPSQLAAYLLLMCCLPSAHGGARCYDLENITNHTLLKASPGLPWSFSRGEYFNGLVSPCPDSEQGACLVSMVWPCNALPGIHRQVSQQLLRTRVV